MRLASRSGIGLDPGGAAGLKAFLSKSLQFFATRRAIDAVRVGLTVMDATRLLGKALADIVAVLFDLPPHFHQGGAHLRRRYRQALVARAADIRCHPRLLHLGVAAIRASDLAGLVLCLEALAVADPGLEFMAGRAAQREQDHRANLLTRLSIPEPSALAIMSREC